MLPSYGLAFWAFLHFLRCSDMHMVSPYSTVQATIRPWLCKPAFASCCLRWVALRQVATAGLLAIVWIDGVSSHLVRRLLPASVLVPALVGFVILRNPISRIDPRLAAAVIVLLNIVIFSAMVLRASLVVYRLQGAKQSAEILSKVDPLTQVLNRRGLELAIDRELMRWQRFKTKFSLVIMDIDHFKSVNDRHGHLMGDAVLQKLAEA